MEVGSGFTIRSCDFYLKKEEQYLQVKTTHTLGDSCSSPIFEYLPEIILN